MGIEKRWATWTLTLLFSFYSTYWYILMLKERSLRTEKGNWTRTVHWFNRSEKSLPWKPNGLLKCHHRGMYLPPKCFPGSVSAESIYGACFHTSWDPSLTAYFYVQLFIKAHQTEPWSYSVTQGKVSGLELLWKTDHMHRNPETYTHTHARACTRTHTHASTH